jgi:acetylornithine deacetylase/succinyl-diaminopimelate desuccinylase-like protein
MTVTASILTRADENLPKSLDRLFDLVRIQSISTDPAYKAECRKAAEWLVSELNGIGFEASVRDTPGHPMVVAHHVAGEEAAPHVLFYGHYDVQPVDPLNLWDTAPFEPAIQSWDCRRQGPVDDLRRSLPRL